MHAGQGSGDGSRTQPVVTGEVQPSDPWAVDEPLYTNVSAASSVQFAGIKCSERTGAEQVQADHGRERFHDRRFRQAKACLTSFRLCWRALINVCSKVSCFN